MRYSNKHRFRFLLVLPWLSVFSVSVQVLSMKSVKKQMKKIKNMTVKDMVTTLMAFYLSVLLGLLHMAFSVARGFCRIFYNSFMGEGLVEGAKTIKVRGGFSGLETYKPFRYRLINASQYYPIQFNINSANSLNQFTSWPVGARCMLPTVNTAKYGKWMKL